MPKILVVDDEHNIIELVVYNLKTAGYETISAEDGKTGLALAIEEKPDLILLDVMLPGMNGLDVCRELRNEYQLRMPIIMLTARADEIDKVLGLEFGADDYMTKPFSIRELMARIKAALRRSETAEAIDTRSQLASIHFLEAGVLTMDIDKHEVYVKDRRVELTFKEFEVLKTLLQYRRKVITRDYLLNHVWGFDHIGETRTVDVHVRYLRKKLGLENEIIQTIRGVGYKIQ
jgi:two-component system alkaline phosphatase synthesis response regulator PhoP